MSTDDTNTAEGWGDSPFIPGLFNTQLFENISEELVQGIQGQRRHIDAANLRYKIMPNKLPAKFDPRSPINFPPEYLNQWFYKTYKGEWSAITSLPLDQAGCGSCWAFSTASQFGEVIRFNLMKLFGDKACINSPFFIPTFVCTGDSEITPKAKGAVVNPGDVKLYAAEIRDRISEYFTVAFSPKLGNLLGRPGLDKKCNDALNEWKSSIATKGRVPKVLSEQYNNCLGCQGNLIVCPLMLFTGAEDEAPGNARGAPLITDFPLHEWACLWGSEAIRKTYCSTQFLSGDATLTFPKLYKADSYSYVTAKEFDEGKRVRGINSMADWMRVSIINYGTITIGFSVFPSFLGFFGNPENAKRIYTAEQFLKDFREGKNSSALGGHAVVVVGWSEDMQTDSFANGGRPRMVRYWIVRNSWGTKWGDNGYFKVQREIDGVLQRANTAPGIRIRFESEFGSLYFAPGPNPELYDDSGGEARVNQMKEFLLPVPLHRCPSLEDRPDLLELMNKNCRCRCGYSWKADSKSVNGCEPIDLTTLQSIATPTVTELSPDLMATFTEQEKLMLAGAHDPHSTLPNFTPRSLSGCRIVKGYDSTYNGDGKPRFTVLDKTVYIRPEPIPICDRAKCTDSHDDSDPFGTCDTTGIPSMGMGKTSWYLLLLLLLLLVVLGVVVSQVIKRTRSDQVPASRPKMRTTTDGGGGLRQRQGY